MIQAAAETAYDMVSPGTLSIEPKKVRRFPHHRLAHQPVDLREGVAKAYSVVKEVSGCPRGWTRSSLRPFLEFVWRAAGLGLCCEGTPGVALGLFCHWWAQICVWERRGLRPGLQALKKTSDLMGRLVSLWTEASKGGRNTMNSPGKFTHVCILLVSSDLFKKQNFLG